MKNMTRGLRNNNPLNIRHSKDKWKGAATTQTDAQFVQFESMAYGYRAAWKILDTYCLKFRRKQKSYNVRNIVGRWAPQTENDTEAYISTVVCLSGLGGYENIPRPNRYRNFDRLEKTARLIAAMTCVENGLRWEQVDWKAIWEGYDLAYPGRRLPGLAAETAMNTPPAWEEPTTEDLQRAADLFIWDEYRDW